MQARVILLVEDNQSDIDFTRGALSSKQKDLMESHNLGADSSIRKPGDFNQFAEAVRTRPALACAQWASP
jgi:hypothetical protein